MSNGKIEESNLRNSVTESKLSFDVHLLAMRYMKILFELGKGHQIDRLNQTSVCTKMSRATRTANSVLPGNCLGNKRR